MIEIKKGIPIPEKRASYPFRQMEIGDCFVLPAENAKKLRTAVCPAGKRLNMKFAVRTIHNDNEPDWVGCWRIA